MAAGKQGAHGGRLKSADIVARAVLQSARAIHHGIDAPQRVAPILRRDEPGDVVLDPICFGTVQARRPDVSPETRYRMPGGEAAGDHGRADEAVASENQDSHEG